jgi:RNA polymerase sigma-70 factor (sigma-E family)
MNDAQTLTEHLASATADFEAFVAARSAALWRSAYLLTGDRQRAEDLLQTALVKAWRRWDRIAHREAVESYVRAALVSTYTDWWRRRWNGEISTGALPERSAPSETAHVDVRRDVLAALALLPRGQRAVVVLRYFDDLTEAQTAAALGVSIGTVKSQSARALAALRGSPLFETTGTDS